MRADCWEGIMLKLPNQGRLEDGQRTVVQKVSDINQAGFDVQKILKIEPTNNLADDLGMDSMGAVEFVKSLRMNTIYQ